MREVLVGVLVASITTIACGMGLDQTISYPPPHPRILMSLTGDGDGQTWNNDGNPADGLLDSTVDDPYAKQSPGRKAVFGDDSAADDGGNPGTETDPAYRPMARQHENDMVLVCASRDIGTIGTDIDCTAVCEKVCNGQDDCMCRTEPGKLGCWVPKDSAKHHCANVKECSVISNFDVGSKLIFDNISQSWMHDFPLGYNQTNLSASQLQEWSHLGKSPITKKKNFRAAVCEKIKTGCWDCQAKCGDQDSACAACFKQSHGAVRDVSMWDKEGYCEAGARDSVCAECECCDFKATEICNAPLHSQCGAPVSICPNEVSVALRQVSKGNCNSYVSKVLSRSNEAATWEQTCGCLKSIDKLFPTMDLNCALVRTEKTLKDWMKICLSTRCTKNDNCMGCLTHYKPPSTAAAVGMWHLLKDINIPVNNRCEYVSALDQCVLVDKGDKGALKPEKPCSANRNGFAFPEEPGFVVHKPPISKPLPEREREWYGPSHKRGHRITTPGNRDDPSPSERDAKLPGSNATDLENTIVGNDIAHRHYLDNVLASSPLYVVMGCVAMPDDGVVDEWRLYAGTTGRLIVQVLRKIDTPPALEENPDKISTYSIVGTNTMNIIKTGPQTFPIPPTKRIRVRKGDVIGFQGGRNNTNNGNNNTKQTQTGIVSWSKGGSNVLFRYGTPTTPTRGKPNHREWGHVDQLYRANNNTMVFVGDGVMRTYSIAAKGRFPGSQVLPQLGSEVSHSASPLPSPSNACDGGPQYWCTDPSLGEECGIDQETWTRTCRPSPSPSPLECDPLMRCPKGMIPPVFDVIPDCFVPSRDCKNCTACSSVWRQFDLPTFGATNGTVCPYCMAGADWSGTCARGTLQSPISIKWGEVTTADTAMMFFAPRYNVIDTAVEHSAYALTLRGEFGELNVEGTVYDATAVVVHVPAEHQMEGQRRAAAELQIVHKQRYATAEQTSLKTLIVSVLFDDTGVEGADTLSPDNIEMSKITGANLPRTPESPSVRVPDFDLGTLVGSNKPIVWYNGSLTFPPCAEGVQWAVQMGQNSKLTASQVNRLNAVFKNNHLFAGGRGNNRAPQHTNGRRLLLKHNCGSPGAIACGRPA